MSPTIPSSILSQEKNAALQLASSVSEATAVAHRQAAWMEGLLLGEAQRDGRVSEIKALLAMGPH